MLGLKEKLVGAILGVAMLGATTAAVMQSNATYFSHAKASAYETTLNHNNAPTLSAGEGTIVDSRGITWEYHNASNSSNGHVVLGADSYVGVSHNSSWGITAIDAVTANFTTGQSSEGLWLLKSTDGITWHESEILTSGQETYSVNNWRYIRFYNYTSTIDIASISVGYACSGISATEDVDLAKAENVNTDLSSVLEAEATSTISPLSDGGQALRLYNGASGDSSYIVVSFPKIDSWHTIFTDAIEFDYYHINNQYKPSIQLMNGTNKIGTVQSWDNKKSNYKATDIDSDWWHCEISISSLAALYVDHTDKATKDCSVDGIRIVSSGNCIIDNLKISSSPCELGNYNNPSYKPKVGEYYWLKTSWVGKLYSVDIDNSSSLFTYTPTANSPFYIYCDALGTVDITVEIECGYNHRSYTITKTVTIN